MSGFDQSKIRNFCIIAHIDHGKSTLADRILERTGVMQQREMTDQVLDSMELERERGITIKSKAVRMPYTAKDGAQYELNLIDTPGHVDFTYEVSRALVACEGAILVVDASQGIEAQTLANVYMALEHDLEILPVINKIDLPSADPEGVKQQIEDEIGLDTEGCPLVSAKQGIGIDDVLEDVVNRVPAPSDDVKAPLRALIFDSYYDNYRGAISSVRMKGGVVRVGDRIRMMSSGREFEVTEVGAYLPLGYAPKDALRAGEVGYIAASIKDIADIHVGDTITNADAPAAEPLPGYKPVLPMVYCGIYPADGADYESLRDALEKLRLNDAALSFEPETSRGAGLRLPLPASWAFCTWRSFRSGWSASSTSISSPPRPASSTASSRPTAAKSPSTTPRISRRCRRSTGWRSPSWTRRSSRPRNSWAPSWSCARTSAVPSGT